MTAHDFWMLRDEDRSASRGGRGFPLPSVTASRAASVLSRVPLQPIAHSPSRRYGRPPVWLARGSRNQCLEDVPCCGRPVVTTYSGCYGIQNHTPLEATVEFTLTPIGVDGRDYSDVEHVPDRSTVSSRGTLSGCGGGLARDFNVSRPIAAQYRLRVDYTYPDGFTGSAEGVAPVRIVRDELAPR
jgi:hypothetical protein